MNFGAMTPTDADLLQKVLDLYWRRPLRFLEIGVHEGNTARGIYEHCKRYGTDLIYWGIDVNIQPSFDWSHFVQGRSEEVFDQVPEDFDVVFVDGCHCVNHVILDALHYGSRIVVGGFMLFHDTAPQVQHVQKNHWVHPEDSRVNRTEVLLALQTIGWPNKQWVRWGSACDPKSDIGGIEAFQKAI